MTETAPANRRNYVLGQAGLRMTKSLNVSVAEKPCLVRETKSGMFASALDCLTGNWSVQQRRGHVGVAHCLHALKQNTCLRIRDLTRIAGLSRRGLHKAFHSQLGQTPGRILRAARMQRACELLTKWSLDLDIIAKRCGYRSANGLYVAFRRDLGMTPTAVRKLPSARVTAEPKLRHHRLAGNRRFELAANHCADRLNASR